MNRGGGLRHNLSPVHHAAVSSIHDLFLGVGRSVGRVQSELSNPPSN